MGRIAWGIVHAAAATTVVATDALGTVAAVAAAADAVVLYDYEYSYIYHIYEVWNN